MGERSFVKSPVDNRDWVFENLCSGGGKTIKGVIRTLRSKPPIITPPAEFLSPPIDYTDYEEPIRDQGSRGTCAAFAGAAIKEMYENMRDGRQPATASRYFDDAMHPQWLSPEFIYYHREVRPIGGMYGRNVFKILQQIGTVPEEHYPYSDEIRSPANSPRQSTADLSLGEGNFPQRTTEGPHVARPTVELMAMAAAHRISNYARIDTADGLRQALSSIGPCYMSLPLYRKTAYFWRPVDDVAARGHAVVVVGYNGSGFILRNSWGADWNGDGHTIFPYSDWKYQWECWVPIDIDEPATPPIETIIPDRPLPRWRRWIIRQLQRMQQCVS